MKKKGLLLICLLSAFFNVNAQTAENKYAVGLYLGKNEYVGELGNGVLNFKQKFYLLEGVSFASYLTPSFDIGLQGSYGGYGYFFNSELNNNFGGRKFEGSLFLHYKFDNGYFLDESSSLSPFIELGWGLAGYDAGGYNQASRVDTKGTDFIVPFGVGLKYKITKNLALQYKFVYNLTNHDYRDKMFTDGVNDKNDAFAEHSFGVVFCFGKPKDSDHDGVPDYLDKCPNTRKGLKVNSSGCPLDTDGDGVPDYLDKCPNTPAGEKVDAHGCVIDADGDGVPDNLDKCPNTPKNVKVDAAGCPIDTDGDGVPDYLDKCPNSPVGTKVDATGCPTDSDGDGVPDNQDKCPDTPKDAKVDATGCPLDSDGDGVPDYLDKCPDVKGMISNKGCPAIKAETKKIFAQALRGIQFEAGKDIIKKTSNEILDKVISVMKENPYYNLEINGHTDSQGIALKNLELSQKRAEAVKNYLVKGGVDASKLTAKGLGQSVPIASNTTPAGREKNRRVEFKVNF
jgi:OmpA-OmpF porin, OOP family